MDSKGFLAVFFLAALPSMAWGQAVGSEFQVNTYTTGGQFRPSVSSDADGNFVVIWESRGQDGSVFGVFESRGRRVPGQLLHHEQPV